MGGMKLKTIHISLESICNIPDNTDGGLPDLQELKKYINEGPYKITHSKSSTYYYFKWDSQHSVVYFTTTATKQFIGRRSYINKGINILEVGIPKRNDNQIEWTGHNIDRDTQERREAVKRLEEARIAAEEAEVAHITTVQRLEEARIAAAKADPLMAFNCTLFYLQCIVALINIKKHFTFISNEAYIKTIIQPCYQDMNNYAKKLILPLNRDLSDVIAYHRLSSVFDNPTHITHIYKQYFHDRTVVPPVISPNKEDVETTERVFRHRNQLIKMREISDRIQEEDLYNKQQDIDYEYDYY